MKKRILPVSHTEISVAVSKAIMKLRQERDSMAAIKKAGSPDEHITSWLKSVGVKEQHLESCARRVTYVSNSINSHSGEPVARISLRGREGAEEVYMELLEQSGGTVFLGRGFFVVPMSDALSFMLSSESEKCYTALIPKSRSRRLFPVVTDVPAFIEPGRAMANRSGSIIFYEPAIYEGSAAAENFLLIGKRAVLKYLKEHQHQKLYKLRAKNNHDGRPHRG